MKSFKIIIKNLAWIVLLGYIVYALIKEKNWTNASPCERLAVCVKDSTYATFVSEKDVLNILDVCHLNPVGIPMNKINSHRIEEVLKKHHFILEAQCYKTADNVVHIDVQQRLPVMRILSCNGDNYYIDGKGNKLSQINYPADVVIATGYISPKYSKKYLALFGTIFQKDDFWNSQVEQLNILKDGTVEMLPRVGNHVVDFGQPFGIQNKLDKLKIFYEKVLCRVGWNKYSRINMEYGNQIICTKTE